VLSTVAGRSSVCAASGSSTKPCSESQAPRFEPGSRLVAGPGMTGPGAAVVHTPVTLLSALYTPTTGSSGGV